MRMRLNLVVNVAIQRQSLCQRIFRDISKFFGGWNIKLIIYTAYANIWLGGASKSKNYKIRKLGFFLSSEQNSLTPMWDIFTPLPRRSRARQFNVFNTCAKFLVASMRIHFKVPRHAKENIISVARYNLVGPIPVLPQLNFRIYYHLVGHLIVVFVRVAEYQGVIAKIHHSPVFWTNPAEITFVLHCNTNVISQGIVAGSHRLRTQPPDDLQWVLLMLSILGPVLSYLVEKHFYYSHFVYQCWCSYLCAKRLRCHTQ